MQTTTGRRTLERLIGKTVAEISHTDRDEYERTKELNVYLFFTDGSTLTVGKAGFQVFKPGEYGK